MGINSSAPQVLLFCLMIYARKQEEGKTILIYHFKELLKLARRENLHRIFFWVFLITLLSTLGGYLFEDLSVRDSLWWSIVTLTTVGYGDISPSTMGGRVIAVVVMFFGIGLLGMLSATLASIMIEKKLKKERGLSSYKLKNHIILCEWNHRTRVIFRELCDDVNTSDTPIVLIAPLEQKPLDDERLLFIRGEVNEESLSSANLTEASTVIIVGDDQMLESARDAKSVLSVLTVESLNPDVYTIVELESEKNVQHCQRANANEIIVGGMISSTLISRAALNHGITHVVSELLSSQFGNELYKVDLPQSYQGKSFLTLLTEMKEQHQALVIAVQKQDGNLLSNPAADYQLQSGDALIMISENSPVFA